MVDLDNLDDQVHSLFKEGRIEEAEALLREHSDSVKAPETREDRILFLSLLAHFYMLTGRNDAAEKPLLEAEFLTVGDRSISGHVYRKTETASLYFWSCRDFERTVTKINEIPSRAELVAEEEGAYYTAQTLKGHALLELGILGEAECALDELYDLIQKGGRYPFGDEVHFLEALCVRELFSTKCTRVLTPLVKGRIWDDELRRRAERLLNQIADKSKTE